MTWKQSLACVSRSSPLLFSKAGHKSGPALYVLTSHSGVVVDSRGQRVRFALQTFTYSASSQKTREAADPLDVNQWIFFVCPTSAINEHFKNQKSISLQTVARIGLPEVRFDEMAQQVDAADLAQSIAILEHHRDQRA